MDDQELTEFVVSQIAKGVGYNDIVGEVCQRSGRDWPTAQAFVNQVSIYQEPRIARRQGPLLFGISLATLIGGMVLVVSATLPVYELASQVCVGKQVIPCVVTLFFTSSSVYGQFFLGAAMIAGGGIGVWRTAGLFA
jgi:hypothetical protein